MKLSKKEEKIITEIKRLKGKSLSHDLDHVMKVADYALRLSRIYGGRREIIIPACLLHDLGRMLKPKVHGKESAAESAKLAKPILTRCHYKKEEIGEITRLILEHDQPGFSSTLLESKILKDADFLDGFGSRGLLRAIYYTAEAGESLGKVVERLKVTMRKRFDGLEFPESEKMAQAGWSLVRLVLAYLKHPPRPDKKLYDGKLIIFEGISGTGKETQANLLRKYLEKRGKKVKLIFYPSQRLKETLKCWRKDKIDLLTEALLFIADRRDMIDREVVPALKRGKYVISLRDKTSTLVYQVKTSWEEDFVNFLYSTFEPQPDIIFHFDLDPKSALYRIEKRSKETGEEKGVFEKLKLLTKKRERYKKILTKLKNVVAIDASKAVDEIHKEIMKKLAAKIFD